MSKFSGVDSILIKWLRRRRFKWLLHFGYSLQTNYQDEQVRAFSIRGKNGKMFQIWIDEPESRYVEIHIWDFKSMRRDWRVLLSNFKQALDDAEATANEWGRA